jgi:hypothetical protein
LFAGKRSQLSSETAPQDSTVLELPEASSLLSQLRSRRKKSKADLADVEAILELLPEMSAQLPYLCAARDELFKMGSWKFEKGEKRERFYAFADALIEKAAKLDTNYSLIQRLQSDLKQEQQRAEGHLKGRIEEREQRQKLEKKLGRV